MKRSEINSIMRKTKKFLAQHRFHFADSTGGGFWSGH